MALSNMDPVPKGLSMCRRWMLGSLSGLPMSCSSWLACAMVCVNCFGRPVFSVWPRILTLPPLNACRPRVASSGVLNSTKA